MYQVKDKNKPTLSQPNSPNAPVNKFAPNQGIIEALQELNTLLDEEAQQVFDPEDKELWARVGNRIDTIDYKEQSETEIQPVNPAPDYRPQLELVAPRSIPLDSEQVIPQNTTLPNKAPIATPLASEELAQLDNPIVLSNQIADLLIDKLQKFDKGTLSDEERAELCNSIQGIFSNQP